MNLQKVTNTLLEAVWINGEYVLNEHNLLFSQDGADTNYKSDSTTVTRVDLAVNDSLMYWAEQNNLGYVGEEGNGALDKEYVMYVDSIDGTIAFTRGMNTATIIACILRMDGDYGVPIASILHNPISGHTWFTDNGATTYMRGSVLEMRYRETSTLKEVKEKIRTNLCVFPGASHNLGTVKQLIESDSRFSDQSMGAFGYGAGLICSGILDATAIGATAATESAAMSLLVQNAGGVACDLEGNPLLGFTFGEVRGKPDFVLPKGALFASNNDVAKSILDIIEECN